MFSIAELPTLTQMPRVVSRNCTSIRIGWDAWNIPPDTGDGPVADYFIYYRSTSDPSWSTLRVSTLVATVTELDADTLHQFMVLPIHEDGFAGFGSPPLNVSTCAEPSSGPVDVSVDIHTIAPARNPNGLAALEEEDPSTCLTMSWQVTMVMLRFYHPQLLSLATLFTAPRASDVGLRCCCWF